MKIKETIEKWIDSPHRNTWLYFDGFKIYVRKTKRYGKDTFDLATIQVDDPGQGLFTKVLPIIEQVVFNRFSQIYVENVLSKRFGEFFKRNGYKEIPNDYSYSLCLVKEK